MTIFILISVLILVISFLASSMEAALFTVTQVQIEEMVEKRKRWAMGLRKNKEEIRESIIAIVILNNVANIAGSIAVGAMAVELIGELLVGVFSGVLTFIIILFGEVVPKTFGERNAAEYARVMSPVISTLRFICAPLILLIKFLTRPFGGSSESGMRISEEHITFLSKLSHRHGAILEAEDKLIRRVFQLDDTLARDIMTPRTVVFALPAASTLEAAAEQLFQASVSRIPLYGESLDDIVGVAHIRDLLAVLAKGKGGRELREFAADVTFVPDTARANMLLNHFQRNREHLSIVVDEHGGMAGVITLEDVLEQLVGEIVDEHDRDVDLRIKARMLAEMKRSKRI
jgi:CBS domain containing-hemolysin-like protein